jgi:hypothetical protein
MRLAILVTLLAAGCDGSSAPPPPTDGGPPRDAGPSGMDAMVDGAVALDGGDLDGSMMGEDATVVPDGGDAGRPDGGADATITPFDAGPLPDAAPADPCTLVPPGMACTAGSCPAGEACLDNGCGTTRCYAGGSPCAGDADCPAGSTCSGASSCVRTAGGCTDSRDCPLGHSCDSSSCVDRRIGCSPTVDCPQGFYCDANLAKGVPYCVRANTRCTADTGCLFRGMCRDVAGTGTRMCHISTGPNCRTNADCTTAGEVCGSEPTFVEATCQPYGPCATAADCTSGWSCRDLWGDGIPECVPPGGSCVRQSDCAAGAVCAVPFTGGPATCISRPL